MNDELLRMMHSHGATLAGFADLTPAPEESRRGFPRAISFCMALTPSIVAGITRGPTLEYRAEYDRLNGALTSLCNDVAAWLTARGFHAEARPASHDIDWKTISSPFPHKMAATLSGLGWIGKCDLLVTPCYGSAVRFASVLTDAPLKTGTPETASRCGDCHACVDVCPGKACSGRNWTPGCRREDIWDPRKCMEGMAAINKRLGVDTHICGMCIAACPHTKAYVRRANAA